jgi:hypothetical protein
VERIMTFAVNGFNPVVVSNQPVGSSAATSSATDNTQSLLQDVESLLQSVEGILSQANGNASSPMNAPSTGMARGNPSSPMALATQGAFQGGAPLTGGNPNAPQPQVVQGGAGIATPVPSASSGPGTTDLTRVNMQMPGSNGVPLFQGAKNADGSTDLYSTDGDGKGIQHRGKMNADGSVTFDNQDAMGKVVDFNGDGNVDISQNSNGTYTIAAGEATLTAGDLSDS